MSNEIKMSNLEKNVKASSVMQFAEMIRSAYESGFIDNHPSIYDIYRAAQNHVNDNYGVKTDNWDDEFASASRANTHDQHVARIAELTDALETMLSIAKGETEYSLDEIDFEAIEQLLEQSK